MGDEGEDDNAGDGRDPRLSIALERSWKSVAAQQGRLDKFHDRALGLLGAVSVMVGVSSAVNSRTKLDLGSGWARVALGAFALAAACAVYVLVPRRWRFDSDPSTFRWYFENATVEELRSSLLEDAERDYRRNGAVLNRLGWVLTAETALVGLAAGALLMAFLGG
jgi:hypothetical protein